ncbi:MAG: propionate CoA-transferase [Firmicutes bacterium]|nr:propionate CoA-transferase [Bacillota bacterium]
MFTIMEAEEAVKLIPDGAVIGLNSFVGLANPEAIHDAITESFRKTGHPKDLTLISSAGFGLFDPERSAENYIREGAVKKIICGHFGAMPSTKKLVLEDRFEAYNLPLGPMSHGMRAQAGGHEGYLSRIGLGLFVDPRIEGPGLNNLSKDQSLVELVEFEGEEYLKYRLPAFNIAIIKASSVDAYGNISFEDEYCTIDALSIAQLTKRNKGKVLVQVDRVRHDFSRPRDVIIPAAFVDAVVVKEPAPGKGSNATMSGDLHVPSSHMQYWYRRLEKENAGSGRKRGDDSADIIGRRAAKELKPGDIVNIGFGIPEMVGKYATASGILKDLTLTVESGGMGGLPAGGLDFGAMIGAGTICDMASQFDFYDGGGLDICFMGGLEMDRFGNVNAHRGADQVAGIGGFGNITAATHNVVFCLTTSTKGLDVREEDGQIRICSEGSIPKIVDKVRSISFSGDMAVKNGQHILYVTERCVFELRKEGLTLTEVYPGVDVKKDILDRLPFEVKVDLK